MRSLKAPEVCRQDLAGGPVTRVTYGTAWARIAGSGASPRDLGEATADRPVETVLARYWLAT